MVKKLTRLSEKRKRYYTMIMTYKRRRQELRKQYGITKICPARYPLPPGYVKSAKKFRDKIYQWNKEIKRIDTLSRKISTLERSVNEFTGIKISEQVGLKISDDAWMAKAFYYKYGLENGIPNIELRTYIGLGLRQQGEEPALFRSWLTKSFKTKPENKVKWMQFKAFYENEFKASNLANKRAYSTHVPKMKDNVTYPRRA